MAFDITIKATHWDMQLLFIIFPSKKPNSVRPCFSVLSDHASQRQSQRNGSSNA
jgi:hypothetical protein